MSEEKKEETKTYVVTRPNTAGLKPGDPDLEVNESVELTPQQAASRVGKIRPQDQVNAEASKAGRKSKLETEHKALTVRVAELEAQNKALHDENVKLKAAP